MVTGKRLAVMMIRERRERGGENILSYHSLLIHVLHMETVR